MIGTTCAEFSIILQMIGKRNGRFSFSLNVFVVRRHPFSILNIKRTFSYCDVYRLSALSREATRRALKEGEDENILRVKE